MEAQRKFQRGEAIGTGTASWRPEQFEFGLVGGGGIYLMKDGKGIVGKGKSRGGLQQCGGRAAAGCLQ